MVYVFYKYMLDSNLFKTHLCVLALSVEGSLFAEVVAGVSEAAAADLRLTVVLLGGRTPVLLKDIVHLLKRKSTVCWNQIFNHIKGPR